MNEHVRTINNTVELWIQRYTCIGKLTRASHKLAMKDCLDMIERIREGRHQNTLKWSPSLTYCATKARMATQMTTWATCI